jgi:hypothetical protein
MYQVTDDRGFTKARPSYSGGAILSRKRKKIKESEKGKD